MKQLTDRQLEAVKFIYEGQKSGNTPTLFELAEKLGVSSRQTVKDLLDAIARKGYLVREPRRPRAIMLKAEAIDELKKDRNFFENKQLDLGLLFSQSPNSFPWLSPINIVINQGRPSSDRQQVFIDNSSSISLATDSKTAIDEYTQFQFVVEKSNFGRLQNPTNEFLVERYRALVVTPVMPSIENETGYLVIDGNSQYHVIWSGVNSGHYYHFGKEYGGTTNAFAIDGRSGQMKFFSQSMNSIEMSNTLSNLKKSLRSWSHYVDFPIYGAALKKTDEVIFWSRKTAGDITGTGIICNDRVLLRDVAYNFPKLTNNSTQ